MKAPQLLASLTITTAAFALSGCGGDEPVEAAAKAPTERHIFVSAVDCEGSEKFAIEDCEKAIDRAIRSHDKQAPSYKSVGTCEETEGADKCERVGDKAYRPRLAAYVFDHGKPPAAKPLYLTLDGAMGFRTAEKEALLTKDDNLIFSKSASDLAELHAGRKKK